MDRDRYVTLALVAFGLVLVGFVLLGFGRIFLGYHTAQLLSAPFGLTGFALVVVLFIDGIRTVARGRAGD
ncbi:hypothetical protein [Haloarchaeobius salinus]|uniref:hypothetical protein n=1 Tax=Haloarchaeobius salinus TaxID=1198298 RepID=UPI00210948AC|nr:hypothetical protein [Haloarchaeobius salinus]